MPAYKIAGSSGSHKDAKASQTHIFIPFSLSLSLSLVVSQVSHDHMNLGIICFLFWKGRENLTLVKMGKVIHTGTLNTKKRHQPRQKLVGKLAQPVFTRAAGREKRRGDQRAISDN